MKLYIVADVSPCFDCSTIEVIAIYDNLSQATEKYRTLKDARGTYKSYMGLDILEMNANDTFDSATSITSESEV